MAHPEAFWFRRLEFCPSAISQVDSDGPAPLLRESRCCDNGLLWWSIRTQWAAPLKPSLHCFPVLFTYCLNTLLELFPLDKIWSLTAQLAFHITYWFLEFFDKFIWHLICHPKLQPLIKSKEMADLLKSSSVVLKTKLIWSYPSSNPSKQKLC